MGHRDRRVGEALRRGYRGRRSEPPGAQRRGLRVPRAQRRGQNHHDPHAPGPHPSDPGTRAAVRPRCRGERPGAVEPVGSLVETATAYPYSHRARESGDPAHPDRLPGLARPIALSWSWGWKELARRQSRRLSLGNKQRPGRGEGQLLSRIPDSWRWMWRCPRSRGHRRGPQDAAAAGRGAGRDGVRIEPHPRRGRPARGPDRDHPPGEAGRGDGDGVVGIIRLYVPGAAGFGTAQSAGPAAEPARG